MFCPKCGLQNAEETKFCRGCGTDLSNVLAVVEGKLPEMPALSEKYAELYSRGIKGVLIGLGFSFISWVVYTIPPGHGIFWTLFLAFAFIFLGAGISRLVHAAKIKTLIKESEHAALPSGNIEYIKPATSIYDTDNLLKRPASVTEHTTRQLEISPGHETKR